MKKAFALLNSTWLFWTLATSFGAGVGFMIVGILSLYSDTEFVQFLIELMILSSCTSLGQWLLLRKAVRKAWLWIPATTLGFSLGYVFPLLSPITVGLLVGMFQWLALHKNLKGAIGWILVSTLAWGLGFFFLGPALFMHLEGFFLGAATGLLIGAISGLFINSSLLKSQKTDIVSLQREAS